MKPVAPEEANAIALENARLDLIANVSHDLRTPLVSLRGYLEVLVSKGDSIPAAQRAAYLAIALRQSEHLTRLVDELFELAKLDFKGITLSREAFQLGELASDVLQKFQLAADERQVKLGVDAAVGLPRVDADLGLIERVFENLIGNALQHTPPGGSVMVRLADAGGLVRAQIADTGAGIPAADLTRVFDRHWRAQPGGVGRGAGLGLAIARRILELHGSTIVAESEPGAGTRFTFALGVALAEAAGV